MLAYFLKNTEIGKEKVKAFIQTLPKVLNPDAMSTYDMIVEEAVEELKEALAEEQQRAKTAILNLHRNFNIPLSEIALIFGKDLEYVEQVIAEEPV